jgi:hypothetical protein
MGEKPVKWSWVDRRRHMKPDTSKIHDSFQNIDQRLGFVATEEVSNTAVRLPDD